MLSVCSRLKFYHRVEKDRKPIVSFHFIVVNETEDLSGSVIQCRPRALKIRGSILTGPIGNFEEVSLDKSL